MQIQIESRSQSPQNAKEKGATNAPVDKENVALLANAANSLIYELLLNHDGMIRNASATSKICRRNSPDFGRHLSVVPGHCCPGSRYCAASPAGSGACA